MRIDTALMLIAGLFGAAGIALYAIAAHAAGGPLDYAAVMLIAHAPALLGLALGLRAGLVDTSIGGIGAGMLALGVALFAGDIACRVLAGDRLFAYAAPLGGLLSIGGWLTIGVAGAMVRRRRPPS